jgi:phosphoribosylanthranilate isomerase
LKFGGSGKKFDWNILKGQNIYLPFFLSGGISPNEINKVKNLNIPGLHAIDLNSKFETKPGLKNIELIREFISKVKLS